MTAEVYKIRDYQSKRAIERAHKELEKALLKNDTSPSEMIPYHGAGIDGIPYQAPPEDCA
jgi:hypothetical protein